MAAIFDLDRDTHRLGEPGARPALRLVASDGHRTDLVPVEIGIRTVHVVVAVAVFALALVLSLAIGNGAFSALSPAPEGVSAASVASGGGEASATIEVRAGDTLWKVARRLQPSGDVRPLVDKLVSLNGSGPLQIGQVLQVPVG